MSKSVDKNFEKQKACELLNELDDIKNPGQKLRNWSIKAQTLLVFTAIKEHCKIKANR